MAENPIELDVCIVGAGPAGLNAARRIREIAPAASIACIEKSVPWEKPMPCAEGVGRLGLESSLPLKKKWIRHTIHKAVFHSPDNTAVVYSDSSKGFIINRQMMQKDLAADLKHHGGKLLTRTRVTAIGPFDRNWRRRVTCDNGAVFNSRVVIDAGGPSSRLTGEESIPWKAADSEPALFVIAENISFENDAVHLYVGKKLAPGGYAWLFPSEKNQANIGVLVGHRFRSKVNLQKLLDTFIQTHFPQARILRRFAGTIPCEYEKLKLSAKGFIKCGDAANTVNPISRAGIAEALISGKLAGECAVAMLGAENLRTMRSAGTRYEKEWYANLGKKHIKLARVKNSLLKVPDKDYNVAAKTLSALPREKITMATIFKLSLGRFPRLVWALRHLM